MPPPSSLLLHGDTVVGRGERGEPVADGAVGRCVVDDAPLPAGDLLSENRGDARLQQPQWWIVHRCADREPCHRGEPPGEEATDARRVCDDPAPAGGAAPHHQVEPLDASAQHAQLVFQLADASYGTVPFAANRVDVVGLAERWNHGPFAARIHEGTMLAAPVPSA